MTLMTKKNTKNAGFSLIELLFAMMFLSVIVFGVIKLQTSNLSLSNTKKLELKAHSYAAQGLEIADSLGAGTLPPACTELSPCYFAKSGSDYVPTADGKEGLEDDVMTLAYDPLFERYFTRDDSGLENGATLITMFVEWTDLAGTHKPSAKRIILN